MDVDSLVSEATARIAAAADTAALEEIRIEVLGRKAALVQALRELASLPPEERRARGDELNRARRGLEGLVEDRERELRGKELEERLRTDRVDVTLPGVRHPRGYSHLIEQTRRDILDVFVGFGYVVVDGPEIDLVHYNFDALNHTPTHPSRQVTDTFYVADDVVLRTHTSPVQIRTMEAGPPPIYMATAGRCYRRDTPDATHTAMFTQIEGLVVDRGITLAHLKGTLLGFARAIFGAEREVRLRPHFFPFTEPSVEVDLICFVCRGLAPDVESCRTCRGEGWIEWGGCGVVNPRVLVAGGIDPEVYSGFAFGMGVERTLMFRHGVEDMRDMVEGDVRFTLPFGTEL
jgi:phenylalanyl-tRNA synthetase alpha chain